MKVVVLNNSTVTQFIEDAEAFENSLSKCFPKLDGNGDGLLSREDLRSGFGGILPVGSLPETNKESAHQLFDEIFERFDVDKNGGIDREEFRSLSKEIMLAMARGIGDSPVQVAVDRESLLMKAVEYELARMDQKPCSD
ncbi:hypothetical protein UlMin_030085 [Ulmus minor]